MVVDVVIPALNEERSIGLVLGAIPVGTVRNVWVCDNGSTDRTREVAEGLGARVVDQSVRGYGIACLTALDAVRRNPDPPDVVVFLDADHSDHPQELPALLEQIAEGADLVIGSRLRGRMEPGAMPLQARFGNWLATRLIRWTWGVPFTDLGPFRAIRWSVLEDIGMRDRTFGWTVEMQIKCARHGYVCAEVPVSYRRRIGVSKISGTVRGTILAGWVILTTWLRYALRS